MIQIKNLTKQYKAGKPIFSDYSNQFEGGTGVGVVGPNGSGKTTFLRIISVNSFPTSGKVLFNDSDVHEKPSDFLKHVGLVHDEENLPIHLTAVELLEWVIRSRNRWSDKSEKEINDLFDSLSLTIDDRNEQIGTYSTGMKKKVQIAAAFILKPKVFIMDEPLRGLDTSSREVVIKLVETAKINGALVFMSSHTMESLSELFDEMIEFPL